MTPAIGLALGLGAAVFWGLTDISATVVSRRVGTLLTAAAMQVTAMVIVGALFVASGQALPSDRLEVAQVVTVGAFSAVGYLATYEAFRRGPISVVSPVMSAYGGLTVILAVIVLGERLSATQAAGAAIATCGVVLTGVVLERDLRRTRFASPGVAFALVAMLLWAWFTILLAGPVKSAGWLPVIALSRTVTGIVLWGLAAAALWYLWGGPRRGRRMTSQGDPGPTPDAAMPAAASPDGAASDGAALDGAALGGAGSDAAGSDALPEDRASGVPRAALARALRGRSTLALAAAMGIFDACGYVVFSVGLEGSMAWLVGLAGSFAPVVTVLFGVGWLRERLRPVQWTGIGLVLAGVAIIGLR
jgi:drug/metabolite transporter (DMT)-like permease